MQPRHVPLDVYESISHGFEVVAAHVFGSIPDADPQLAAAVVEVFEQELVLLEGRERRPVFAVPRVDELAILLAQFSTLPRVSHS